MYKPLGGILMRNQAQLEDRLQQVKFELSKTSDPGLKVRYEAQLEYLQGRLCND